MGEILSVLISTRFTLPTWIIQYNNVIMSAMASQITSLTIVYSTVCSGGDQRKHQSSASLAFVRGRNSPHKCPVTRKLFPFDDVILLQQPFALWVVVLAMCDATCHLLVQCFGKYTLNDSWSICVIQFVWKFYLNNFYLTFLLQIFLCVLFLRSCKDHITSSYKILKLKAAPNQ